MNHNNTREIVTNYKVPATFQQDGHTYRFVGARPHVNRLGVPSWVVTWQGTCAACGGKFEVTTGVQVNRSLNRRCPRHHRPWSKAVPWKDGVT